MAYTTINKSTDHFNTKLYVGNASTNAITGVGFTPSLTWIKNRSDTHQYVLVDAVRGVTKELRSSSTAAQITTTDSFTSFDSDGFTLGADSGDNYNKNSQNMVSWSWKANGAGSSNSNGSITSTVSANASAGFSIVKYSGTGANATVGHGLSTPPRFILIKQYDGSANDWGIYYNPSSGLNGQQGRAMAFTGSGFSTSNSFWNNAITTNTLFNLGDSGRANQSSQNYIAYCFSDVIGYQKFHGWYANANSDGPFLYCGFKPAYFIMFNINNSGRWMIADNKRNTYNPIDKKLAPHSTAAEATTSDIGCDFLSNGIKITGGSTSDINHTNDNMMYGLAIASAPLVGTNNIPCTAR